MKFSVIPSTLAGLVAAGEVRIHRHGSGIYRGRYLALRRTDRRREILATGKPEPLRIKLAAMGIVLYQAGEQWKIRKMKNSQLNAHTVESRLLTANESTDQK